MEYIINKIINMDKEAKKYTEQYEKQIEEDKIAFEGEIRIIKENFIKNLQEEKSKLTNSKIVKAIEEAENIKIAYENEYVELKRRFIEMGPDIVEESFKEIKAELMRSL